MKKILQCEKYQCAANFETYRTRVLKYCSLQVYRVSSCFDFEAGQPTWWRPVISHVHQHFGNVAQHLLRGMLMRVCSLELHRWASELGTSSRTWRYRYSDAILKLRLSIVYRYSLSAQNHERVCHHHQNAPPCVYRQFHRACIA